MKWRGGRPDTSGAAAYTVLIRDPADEDGLEIGGHGFRSGRTATGWKKLNDLSESAWSDRIVALLADGRERTFNRICLELTGGWHHADTALSTNLHDGLWQAVDLRRIYWRNARRGEAGIWFTLNTGSEL
jgi:hypothetical protein